jgi:hypothetical protein
MLHTSLSRDQSLNPNIWSQLLAVAISTGIHYLLVSNLGLFAPLESPKIRPSGGEVKVVELTPAEQTRVPVAVRSTPVATMPGATNVAPVTSPSFVPFGQSNSVYRPRTDGSLRSPIAVPSRIIPKRSFPPSGRIKTPQKPVVRRSQNPAIPTPIASSANQSLDEPIASNPAAARQRNSLNPGGEQATTSLDANEQQKRPTSPRPTVQPESPQPLATPSKPGGELQQVQLKFTQAIQNLKKEVGANDMVERPIQQVPRRTYPPTPRCSHEQNGYIAIGILLDDQGNSIGSSVPLSSSTELGEKKENVFIGNVLMEADGSARQQHEARSSAQKAAEKGKKILYPFIFEYDAKSCPS